MSKFLNCERCGKHMAELRDAKVRNGMVVYCKECNFMVNAVLKKIRKDAEIPDFLKGFMW